MEQIRKNRAFADATIRPGNGASAMRLRALALLLLAAFFWGSGNVAQKTVLEHLGPLTAVGLSSLLAALVLWPLARLERRTQPRGVRPGLREIAIAATVFTGAVATMQIGYGGTSVSNAGFIINSCAAMTPVAAWLILRERPALTLAPAILLVGLGIWLMGGGALTSLAWGDAVCLLSAALFAFSVPLVSRFVLRHGRPAYITAVQFLVCGGICIVLGLSTEDFSFEAAGAALPEILMIGIVGKGLPYLSMAIAQQHTSANTAAIIVSAEAVFGALFARILLGEVMTDMAMVGAVLIMTSIVVVHMTLPVSFRRGRRRPAAGLPTVKRRRRPGHPAGRSALTPGE